MGLLCHTLIVMCNIYVLFVFIDPQAASARKPAGMYIFHVLATGVVPYRKDTILVWLTLGLVS